MFKSLKRKKPLRSARKSSDSDDEEDKSEVNKAALEETIELQKLRKRAHGVNAATLASGKKVTKVDELVHNDPDPFKLKTGGLLNLDKARQAAALEDQPAEESAVGTQFSKGKLMIKPNIMIHASILTRILFQKREYETKMRRCESLSRARWSGGGVTLRMTTTKRMLT